MGICPHVHACLSRMYIHACTYEPHVSHMYMYYIHACTYEPHVSHMYMYYIHAGPGHVASPHAVGWLPILSCGGCVWEWPAAWQCILETGK